MRILVDGVDYTAAVTAEGPITLQRGLQMPTRCNAEIVLDELTMPQRWARVVVEREDSTALFTGSLATDPVRVYAGEASQGAVYRARLNAVSDEETFNRLQPQAINAATHVLVEGDGVLLVNELNVTDLRDLANDITVSGEVEPTAFVSECFLGDGTTDTFFLNDAAFRDTKRVLIDDTFGHATFNHSIWSVSDPGSYLSLTGNGLTASGGTGADGVTMLKALRAVEMGGSLVAELRGVMVEGGTEGTLAGFYQGTEILSSCFAGFHVRQQSGSTILSPLLNGAEVGTAFVPLSGHKYTLRLRLYSAEMQRTMQRYNMLVDGVVQSFGELSGVDAPMEAVFELVDEGVSSSTPATVLYDTVKAGVPISVSPAACMFVALSAVEMSGAIGGVRLTRPGSIWVTGITPEGVLSTRLVGGPGEGADCQVTYGSTTGAKASVVFFDGRIPEANERLTVRYRTTARSVARVADAASLATETANGDGGTNQWTGKVLRPVARSSADCRNAAAAMLAFAMSRSAGITGEYHMVNPTNDVHPGDVLAVTSAGGTVHVLVRTVELVDQACVPEMVRYKVTFANNQTTGFADGLGVQLSEEMAVDADRPQMLPEDDMQGLANLQQLAVTILTPMMIGIDAGVEAPSGGGFEVRRRDYAFGMGVDDGDLVLRSPVRGFEIPRAAQNERYFMRMYDASSPVKYSEWSSSVVVHAPIA